MNEVLIAREYISTPFVHQGRLKGVGIDCIGLVVCVARESGLEIKDYHGYSEQPGQALLDMVSDQLNPGNDIGVFWYSRRGDPQQVAIFAPDNKLICVDPRSKKVVEMTYSKFWIRRLVSSFAWPK